MSGRKKFLCCSVCGSDAGKWLQHHNQDDGYGICRRCIDWLIDKGVPAAGILDSYGEENKNYSPKDPGRINT